MGIEVVIRDHSCAMLIAFSNKACLRLAIEAKILALLEGLLQAKALGLSTLTLEEVLL